MREITHEIGNARPCPDMPDCTHEVHLKIVEEINVPLLTTIREIEGTLKGVFKLA